MVKRYYENDVKLQTKTVQIFECPDCGFEFNAVHEEDEQVGGWECPLCEIERLKKFIVNLQVVHFVEFQREKATVEKYTKVLKEIIGFTKYEGNQWYEKAKKALEDNA